MQYITIQYSTIQYNTLRYITIHYDTLQYITIRHNTSQYMTIHYNTWYMTIHYSTLRNHSITRHSFFDTLRLPQTFLDLPGPSPSPCTLPDPRNAPETRRTPPRKSRTSWETRGSTVEFLPVGHSSRSPGASELLQKVPSTRLHTTQNFMYKGP